MDRREALKLLTALPPMVKSISVADIKPDDVIVVESDRILSKDQRETIKRELSHIWTNRKIVVLGDGLRMRIAREQ